MPDQGDSLIALPRVLAGLALFTGAGAGLIGLLRGREKATGTRSTSAGASSRGPPSPACCSTCRSRSTGSSRARCSSSSSPLPRPGCRARSRTRPESRRRSFLRTGPPARPARLAARRRRPSGPSRDLSALGPFAGWDERAIYGLKARILYHEGSVRGEAFTDTGYLHFQARYPLLVPLLEAALFTLRGSIDDRFLKLLFLLFSLGLALVVAGEARRLHGQRAGSLWALLFLATPMLIGPAEGNGTSAYADLPFAAFVTAATVLLGRSLERPDTPRTLLAGLLLGAALATKQEGVIWAVALGTAAPPHPLAPPGHENGRPRPGRRGRGGPGGPLPRPQPRGEPVDARAAWSERYEVVLNLDWLRQLGSRPARDRAVRPEPGRRLEGVGMGLAPRPRRSPVPSPPATPPAPFFWRATALAVFAADLGVFVVTPNHLHWHLATAFSRLLLHLFPLAILILVEQVGASGWPGPGPGAARRASDGPRASTRHPACRRRPPGVRPGSPAPASGRVRRLLVQPRRGPLPPGGDDSLGGSGPRHDPGPRPSAALLLDTGSARPAGRGPAHPSSSVPRRRPAGDSGLRLAGERRRLGGGGGRRRRRRGLVRVSRRGSFARPRAPVRRHAAVLPPGPCARPRAGRVAALLRDPPPALARPLQRRLHGGGAPRLLLVPRRRRRRNRPPRRARGGPTLPPPGRGTPLRVRFRCSRPWPGPTSRT